MANARNNRKGNANKSTTAQALPKKAPAGNVYVYCAIPNGMTFSTPAGAVTLRGVNAATLVQTDGGRALSAGKFGVNAVSASDWEYISTAYADMDVIRNGLIFEARSQDAGNTEAHEKQDVPTGAEQASIEDMTQDAQQAGLDPSQYVTAAAGV